MTTLDCLLKESTRVVQVFGSGLTILTETLQKNAKTVLNILKLSAKIQKCYKRHSNYYMALFSLKESWHSLTLPRMRNVSTVNRMTL